MQRLATLVAVVLVLAVGCEGSSENEDGQGGEPDTTVSVATSPTSPNTTTVTTTATASCQTIAFTPNSEDAASSVTATGLSCAEAEAFVRVAGQRTSSGGPQQVTVDGFRCVAVRTVQEPIPRAFYECTSDSKKVTFVRS